VHVQPEETEIGKRDGNLGDRQRLIERNPELHSLLAGARVRVRRIDEHLGIDAERNRCRSSQALRHTVEHVELLVRLHVEEKHSSTQRFLHLALGLANAAEDDVLPGIASLQSAEQLTTRYYVQSGTQLSQQGKDGNARIRLHAVMESRTDADHRGKERSEER